MPMTSITRGPQWLGWGNGVENARFQPKDAGQAHRGGSAAAEAQVGVWLREHRFGARAAHRGGQSACSPPARTATSSRTESEDGLHVLDIQGGLRRARRAVRRPVQGRRQVRHGRVLRRHARECVCASMRTPASRSGSRRSTSTRWPASPARPCSTAASCSCPCRASAKKARARSTTTRAARSAATSPRSMRTPARLSGRRTPSARTSRAGKSKDRRADVSARRAAASGRRRRSMRSASSCTSATGNGFADPPQPMTDAVIAMDLDTRRDQMGAADSAERQLGDGLPGEESRQPGVPGRHSARTSISPRRPRCSTRRVATGWCCRRSPASASRSIRTRRARWSGSTASGRAAGWAASGARAATASRRTSAPQTC